MLLTMMALVGAMTVQPEPNDTGRWRIMRETPAGSIAVQLGERPPRAGEFGTAYVLTTYANPQQAGPGGAAHRQRWLELMIKCPHEGNPGNYGDVWNRIAEPGAPLPNEGDVPPPVALRSFSDNWFGPLALAICNGDGADRPVVEGDWATVLTQLLARVDARPAP